MMRFSFKLMLASAKTSKVKSRDRSAFPLSRWFMRFGTTSALAACLMTAAPRCATWADEPLPSPAGSEQSAATRIDRLLESLHSEQAELRKSAAQDLTDLGTSAKPAVPQLLKTLADDDAIVRATAARAVWEIDQRAEALPVLVELLKSQHDSHRELAAYFLGPMGEAGKPAAPALRQAMHGSNPTLRVHAAEALTQIEPAAPDAVNVLLDALRDEEPQVRSLAALAFNGVAPIHAEKVVPVLSAALVDADPGVRTAAELSLTNFNLEVAHSGQEFPAPAEKFAAAASPKNVLPTPENTTPFANPHQAAAAAFVMPGELELSADLENAVQDLSHESPAVRKNALERIGWMAESGEPALADVAVCLQDAHPEVRAYAAKTLWDIDRHSALAAVNTLREMVDSTQPGVRPLAAFYLGYMGRDAVSAVPTLKRALANAESTEQLQIAEAVARIHPEDPDAVTVLLGGLGDPESHVRFQAAYALSQVSPIHAQRVIPELATAMHDQSPEVRQAAELALASFPAERFPEPPAKPQPIFNSPAKGQETQPVPSVSEIVAEEWPAETSQVVLLDPEPLPPAAAVPIEQPAPMVPIEPPAEHTIIARPPGTANASQPENRLGLGEDYKPITAVSVSITPKRRDEDGRLLPLPTNYGAAWLQEVGTHYSPIGESRPWTVQSVQYAASGFCHRPLYFEEINLERYGHNFGHCVQPFVSGVAFFGRAPLLPYMMAAEPPCECQYTLGHYRPGSCAPFQPSHLPWSTTGALVEAGIITGLVFAIY